VRFKKNTMRLEMVGYYKRKNVIPASQDYQMVECEASILKSRSKGAYKYQ